MIKFVTATFAAALGITALAPVANAQSGYDTGSKSGAGTTTNSGEARPDATSNAGPSSSTTGSSSNASPTQNASGGGSGTIRPDAAAASVEGAPKASSNSGKAAPTDTKN